MKRIVIAALLILGSVGVFAQAGTWYFSILPGYQIGSSGQSYNDYWFHYKYDAKNNFQGSLDGGYYFTDNIGLHFAYVYNPGKAKVKVWDNTGWATGVPGAYIGQFGVDRQVNILQIGPEFAFVGSPQ